MSLPRFSIRRPVTTVMIALGVVLLGAIAWTRLPRELFPPITYPQLTVVTHYKDAAPEEIELQITKPIEEVTGTVSGLRRVSSISKEEISLVFAEFNWDANMDFAALGVREKIDLIKERLPRGAEDPVVIKFNPFELPVMVLNVSAKRAPHELLRLVRKQIKNELEKVDGVAAINLSGGLEREILVEVDQGRLQAAGLPISQVVDSLSKANMNYPAGTIKEAFYEYLIRTIGEFSVVKEIPGIAVGVDQGQETERERERERRSGRPLPLERERGVGPEERLILLKDIATVQDTFRERDSISRFNGEGNVSLSIQKQAGANTLQLARRIKEAVGKLRPALPPDIEMSVAYDQSIAIQQAVNGVVSAAMQGGALAFIVLYLFLGNPWAALNVSFAIPISVLATFALMYFSGITINVISLGGLALGIGMLVDAGIVAVENISRHREMGAQALVAAVEGTEEVASAIGGSILTTIVVFLPMVFVVGIAGQLFKELAFTVTFSLLASWGVSLTLTALFASRIRRGVSRSPLEPALRWLGEADLRLVSWFLRHRAAGVGVMAALLAVSLLALSRLDREVLPRVDQGQFILRASLPPGTRLEVTDQVAGRIEQVLQRIREVQDVAVTIGSSKEKRAEELLETLGAHQAQILVNLRPRHRGLGPAGPGTRRRSTSEVVQELKDRLSRQPLEGAEIEYLLQESVFKSALLAGAPVVVEVKGPDLPRLERLSEEVRATLEGIPGLYGVQTSIIPASPETKVNVLKDRAATYHLSVSDIALAAQTAVKGFVATKFKEQGEETDIRVRLRKRDREDFNRVRQLLIHSPLDIDVPLAEVAYLAVGKGPTEIRRLDQQRTVLVSAQLGQRPLAETLREVGSALKRIPRRPGFTVELTGESEQMEESFRSLAFALLLSVILVYMVMASEFESLWQPFLIMGTIPMALLGVALGLGVTGTPISVMAALGFIVLGGVVVDNGIVLIEFVNQLQRRGLSPEEAVMQASQARLRPILMTAGTTVLGLLPLALGLEEGVELQVPMAVTVMGGLTVATFLTLVFLPALYVTAAGFFERFRGSLGWAGAAPAPFPAPAGAVPVPAVALPAEAAAPSLATASPAPRPAEEEGPPPPETSPAEESPQEEPPPPEVERILEEEERAASPEVPEIPEDYGSEEAVPDRPEAGLLPPTPSISPPEPESPAGPAQPQIPPAAPAPEAAPKPAEWPPLNPRQERMLERLRTHRRITRKEYVGLTGASIPTAARDLKELVDRGLIRGFGPIARGRYYELAS